MITRPQAAEILRRVQEALRDPCGDIGRFNAISELCNCIADIENGRFWPKVWEAPNGTEGEGAKINA